MEAVVRSEADAVIVLGVVGMGPGRERSLETACRLQAADGECAIAAEIVAREDYNAREAAFIRLASDLMDRYQKPIINVSFTPVDQAVFPGDGRYASGYRHRCGRRVIARWRSTAVPDAAESSRPTAPSRCPSCSGESCI
jgi:hypothetical protein